MAENTYFLLWGNILDGEQTALDSDQSLKLCDPGESLALSKPQCSHSQNKGTASPEGDNTQESWAHAWRSLN